MPDPGRGDHPCGGIRARAWGVDVGGLSGLPGSATWPPARYGAVVLGVLGAEPVAQLRLLEPVDPRNQPGHDDRGVPDQSELTEQQALPDDEGRQGEIYRVAYVPIGTADYEVLGRCDRGGRTDAISDEAHERADQHGQPGRNQGP